ncbi:MAG: nuclear transport factor 2 family protein [Bryobacteraceae bacterium]|nr:nuclear transport factor 2 family protein [Bryobacteraceae bacterium]
MSQATQQAAQPLAEKVGKMVEVLMAKKWDEFMPYFRKDLFYKVGAAEPLHGVEACRDLLAHIYTKLEFTSHDVRGIFEIGNVVIVEMDANYNVIGENRPVTVPCCDVYRFDENGLIKEWRVYPDASRVGVQF